MAWMRDQGYAIEKVEMPWNPYTRKRKDFAGFADSIAFHPEKMEVVAVQAASEGTFEAHRRKILAAPLFPVWISSGGKVLLVEWRKRKARNENGKRLKREVWEPRAEFLTHQ